MRLIDVTKTQFNVCKNPKNALKCKHKVSDNVRISKYKGVLGKNFTPDFSTELLTTVKVNFL